MKALIYLLLASHAVYGQIAIQLHPKPSHISHQAPTVLARSRGIERVVDWSQLRNTARRATERYGGNEQKTLLLKHKPSRRWIASTILPIATPRILFKIDDKGTQTGDLSKGAAFAKLGMLRGSRYLRLRLGPSGKKIQSRARQLHSKNSTASQEIRAVASKQRNLRSHRKIASKNRTTGTQRSVDPLTHLSGTLLRDSVSGSGDIEFFGQIQVGTPPQEFMIDFDTGSSDMWIKDKTCKKNCGRNSSHNHTFYDYEKSSTSKDLSSPFQISYGVGGVSGSLHQDTVTISGYTVVGQAFGVCDVLSEDWPNDPADGVLGLAFESIATSHKKPWFYNAIAQNSKLNKTLDAEMFSFAMGRYATGSHVKSELFLGGQNQDKYNGEFQWVPLTSKTYWQIQLENVYCSNGKDEKFRVNIPSTAAIVDSGTTYIAAPAEQAKIFWGSIPNSQMKSGDGFYTFPCSQSVKMVFDFGNGVELSVNELDLNLGKVSPGSDRCVGAVFGSETGGNWILGISFMKSYYTTFDFGNSRMGFAKPTYH